MITVNNETYRVRIKQADPEEHAGYWVLTVNRIIEPSSGALQMVAYCSSAAGVVSDAIGALESSEDAKTFRHPQRGVCKIRESFPEVMFFGSAVMQNDGDIIGVLRAAKSEVGLVNLE